MSETNQAIKAVNQWFYGSGSQRVGPLDVSVIEQLVAAGQIRHDTLVWTEGMADWTRAAAVPQLTGLLAATGAVPPTSPGPLGPAGGGADATGGLIPYKNGAALAGYYVAVFSLIPGIGLLLGPLAVVLGIFGLRRARENPQARGKVHAWVAISLGGVVAILHIGVIVMVIAAQ